MKSACDFECPLGIGVRQSQNKLVPSIARGEIGRSVCNLANAGCHCLERFVSGRMPALSLKSLKKSMSTRMMESGLRVRTARSHSACRH